MTHNDHSRKAIQIALLRMLVLVLAMAIPASASWKEKILYSFQGGNDGYIPAGGVVFDAQGNVYGTTQAGGPPTCAPIGNYCGTVYQLSPPVKQGDPWTKAQLYMFKGKGSNDGEVPAGAVVMDTAGNLYGATAYGGAGGCVLVGVQAGCGTVYELSPPKTKGGKWSYKILYSFKSGKDGYLPDGALVFDSAGNLYGATLFGGSKGTTCDPDYQYCGTVFELSPPKAKGGKWTEKVLHSFKGGTDGANPNGGLVLDSDGAIYGTTSTGGNSGCKTTYSLGCGTTFQLKPPTTKGGAWKEKMLHRFTGGNDGGAPNGGLIFDAKRTLYGTAEGGGAASEGIVFQFAERGGTWDEEVVHRFSGYGNAPCCPSGSLVLDGSGDLYGTALGGTYFAGVAYRLTPPSEHGKPWPFAVLYDFEGEPDGHSPTAGLTPDGTGHFYSTTEGGGTSGNGTVFSVTR